MKKLLFVLLSLSLFTAAIFAVDADAVNNDPDAAAEYAANKTAVEVIVPEEQHATDEKGKVKGKVTIEYEPSYDEVRLYYVANAITYERGEAMNTVLACLQDFQREHKYYSYKYLEEPREKSYVDKNSKPKRKYTQYYVHVAFSNN